MGKPTSVKDVDQHEIVQSVATFLKKSGKIKLPDWVDLVKLGKNKELAPINPDWYYVRVASMARRLYIRSPTARPRNFILYCFFLKNFYFLFYVYGGNKRRGVAPNHFSKASGAVIRKALQSLEELKWVEKDAATGGRKLTKQGQKDLDRIASQLRYGSVE
ncbi:40S ribosomal protein S19G [Globodera pallida]|nr:40S ribosomal protein S19G [Globodera pallida]